MSEEAASVLPSASKPARILVVDDEVLIAMTTADMVADLGYQPLEANSGIQALEMLRADGGIALLITDYSMPKMSGGLLIERARSLRPCLPVILTTGYSQTPDDIDCQVELLGKPFSNEQLALAVEKALATPIAEPQD